MALGKRGAAARKAIPHEPTEWMEFRRLPAYELDERCAAWRRPGLGRLGRDVDARAVRPGASVARGLPGRRGAIPEPLTEEARLQLDAPTLLWAYTAAVAHNFVGETPEEKKPDSPPSTTG